jgi:acyl dehydratase
MAIPAEKLGAKFEVKDETIDGAKAKAYALATNDDNPAYASGPLVPPVFGVVPTWNAMVVAMDEVIPAANKKMVVHGERDMHFHRPLVAGMRLHTVSDAFSWRVGGSGTRYTLRISSRDDAGALVLEQYATMFVQKMNDGESMGPDKPDHTFLEEARARRVGEHTVPVDANQTFRYRDASGDDMRIHIDDAFAKSVGLPGMILHGLCTMAMTSRSVLALVGEGDPNRLRRLAVRWAKPALPGNELVTSLYDVGARNGRRAYAFETVSAGEKVVTNGWAELD